MIIWTIGLSLLALGLCIAMMRATPPPAEEECCSPNDAMDPYWCRCHELLGDEYYSRGGCLGNQPDRKPWSQ